MFTSREGYPVIVRRLIEHGADVNVLAKTGDTALVLARHNANDDVARILKDAGARGDAGCQLAESFELTALKESAPFKAAAAP